MSEEEEILKQTVIEEEAPRETLADKLKTQKKVKSKKKIKRIVLFIVLAFFGYAIWFLLKPFKATAEYGICRSLLELFVPYPYSIYVSELKPLRDGSLKLWYTHIDAFGGYRLEEFDCKLLRNETTGVLELSEIMVHKVYLEPERIKYLNNALPYFVENPMVLNWPAALPDSLNDLHFDFNSVRKIIIDSTKR